ncbi:MAG: hypothetical protein IPN69_12700 [Acidobacteria bacterium]|nr:hypothetical protein [Acidobacteriota bacterium]MBK8149069.1 hypothetical protein [Acidobacteriota bacterium]MBK8811576.1 hypothetical protein [Acidobacteriota bacterium]
MKYLLCAAVVVSSSFLAVAAQVTNPTPAQTRPRVIVVGSNPTPTPSNTVIVTNTRPVPAQSPIVIGNTNNSSNISATILTLAQIRQKLAEAKREMSARPITIAMTEGVSPVSPLEMVRVAFYDVETRQIDYLALSKDAFLTKDAEYVLSTSTMKMVKFRILRPNGVNTPVSINGLSGKSHVPLMVQYPVVRNGIYYETAYYMSTHPGLVTPEVIGAGKYYVRNTIDVAREKLRQRGLSISPRAADIAERLSIVEHVDHYRFRTEYHPNIYNDVFTLYALNEGQTYRYSVSSAGAGGMVQMIPSTYRMIRNRFPGAGLMPDFVAGMQDHPNAAQAMLLYIQSTYDDLLKSPTIVDALQTGLATEFELLSAGYNSNPAKLAGYIKRGGANWRNLIPRETQIYLQINASLDRFVPFVGRTR